MTLREFVLKAKARVKDLKMRTFDFPKKREDYLDMQAVYTDDSLIIGGWEVMQEWERPLMRVLARETTRNGGDVLEVGFGMGISAGYIVEYGCASYTVIEPHPQVLQKARAWAVSQSVPVQIEEGFWQDLLGRLGQFDGILFDTFPLTKKEAGKNHIPFIPRASDHLRTGGVFTYYSDASETLGGDHLKLLLEHFSEVRIFKVSRLAPSPGSQYWTSSTMLVPVCTKRDEPAEGQLGRN
jgi:guanidinoacetate N-methyltransferase